MRRRPHCAVLTVLLATATLVAAASSATADVETWMRLICSDYPTTKSSEPIPGYDYVDFYSNELDFDAGIRWPVGEEGSTAWARLLYGWLVLDYLEVDEADSLPRFDKTLYLAFEGNYRGRGASPWGWQVNLTPGWGFGQFDPTSEREFVLGAGVWGLRSVSDDWLLGLGAVHTYVYGRPMYLPSLIAEYDAGGHVVVQAELPGCAGVVYRVTSRVDLGLIYDVRGHYYARNDADFPDIDEPYVAHSVTTLAGAVGFHFDEQLYFRFEGGQVLERALRLVGGTVDILSLDPAGGWFLRGVLEWGGGWSGTPRLR
jgi:hypothetical protein